MKPGYYSRPSGFRFGHDCRRWRRRSAATNTHEIIPQRLDLQIFFAAENVVRPARIKGWHLRSRLNFLRILQPLENPVGVQSLPRHREIRRPTVYRPLGFFIALLMAAKTVEV